MSVAHRFFVLTVVCTACAAATTACSTGQESSAPAADVPSLAPQQVSSWNGWTVEAYQPVVDSARRVVQGEVIFNNNGGPSAQPAGACLLAQVPGSPSCTSNAQCDVYRPNTDSSAYCLTPDTAGTTGTCWVRPGTRKAYCTGSPAADGAAIPATEWYTSEVSSAVILNGAWSFTWVLQGCIQGCAGSGNYASNSPAVTDDQTACGYNGGDWIDGQCFDDAQLAADCESQPPSGMCTTYQWYDGRCNCVT